ncbi:carbohydrate-binding domain-containing protein [Paenibacillus sp. PR3]|uniref:Carbohydrate-binding domain-containing protein n=1 Tax=Paenibacillus terricola TaxID=2763503 RepID=A0ABR8MN76_9BACL|nr:carbohydrate-binding domain-containing protein [Paenibacillus terricola]MBD3917457.1 carbohydrate-binding domain-containing protein [Paenibacillus terricola]
MLNKNKKKLSKLAVIALCTAMLAACSSNQTASTSTGSTSTSNAAAVTTASAAVQTASYDLSGKVEYDEDDAYTDWNASEATTIKLNGTTATIEGTGAEAAGGKISITAAGTYVVSGKLDEGQIAVNVADKGVVRLVLNGAEINYSKSSPIYIEEAGKLILSLPEGTNNVVSDGAEYEFADASTDEPNAAIFSKDDMTINGTGKLTVQANYNNGITSKDKLKITGGTFEIHAADDAVMGRDLVAVKDGQFVIDAKGHGIKTTNDTEGDEGLIALDGGSYSIESGKDGLHSTGGIAISNGDYHIAAGDDGIHSDIALLIAGGTIDITQSYEGLEASSITIAGGETHVAASDDGVNAASGSSDTEGTEGGGAQGGAPQGDMPQDGAAPADMPQDGTAPADMAQGGGGGSRGGGMPGGEGSSNNTLTITGGYLSVDAQGDGLDANGSITMSGGTVVVNGPTMNGNGALDYDSTFNMTGGVLIAAGSSGMVQAASDSSTQAGILMTYPQTQQAGTLIHLEDDAGNAIATFAPSKNYQAVYISSPDMKKDTAYTLYSGGTSNGAETDGLYDGGVYSGGTKVVSFTASSTITWVNESGVTEASSGFGGGFGGGGRGRGGDRQTTGTQS